MDTLPIEILDEITSVIKGDFIAWSSTCKTLNGFNTVTERAKHSNHLLTLIKMFPNKDWDYRYLGKNPNITWEIVVGNSQIKWCYYYLTRNPNITWI